MDDDEDEDDDEVAGMSVAGDGTRLPDCDPRREPGRLPVLAEEPPPPPP